jgi:hypothetical protein
MHSFQFSLLFDVLTLYFLNHMINVASLSSNDSMQPNCYTLFSTKLYFQWRLTHVARNGPKEEIACYVRVSNKGYAIKNSFLLGMSSIPTLDLRWTYTTDFVWFQNSQIFVLWIRVNCCILPSKTNFRLPGIRKNTIIVPSKTLSWYSYFRVFVCTFFWDSLYTCILVVENWHTMHFFKYCICPCNVLRRWT